MRKTPRFHTRSPRSNGALFEAWRYRNQPMIHGLKTAFATALAIGVSLLLRPWMNNTEWIVITVVVVMALLANIGGVIIRGLSRLIATLIAAALAFAVTMLTNYNPVAIGIVLVVGVGFFTWLAQTPRYRQVGLMSAITLAVLLEYERPENSTILWRGVDIAVGVGLAIAVTALVMPFRAARELRFSMADTVDQLGILVGMAAAEEEIPEAEYELIEDDITSGFRAQRDAMEPAMIEQRRVRLCKPSIDSMMRSQRIILGLSRSVRRSFCHTSLGQETIASLPGREEVRNRIEQQLHAIAEGIRTGHAPASDPELKPAEAALKQAMKQATRGIDTPSMSPQAFIFALEQIMNAVETLRRDAGRISFDLTDDAMIESSASIPSA